MRSLMAISVAAMMALLAAAYAAHGAIAHSDAYRQGVAYIGDYSSAGDDDDETQFA